MTIGFRETVNDDATGSRIMSDDITDMSDVTDSRMSDDRDAPGHKVEFVCTICLASVTVLDTDPWPRCWRGHGKMTADDPNVPQVRPRTRRTRARVVSA
jgi:hypothetical protein